MRTETAFWDTSAIIPLYCNQIMSADSRRLRRRFKVPVVWWGTHVEVNSGIRRLLRDGFVTEIQSRTALEKWNKLRSLARTINPDDRVLMLATSLTAAYDIRALDAFQLAASLVWCREKPKNRPFVCADGRLSDAALEAGFDVLFPS